MTELWSDDELPRGFAYPSTFRRVVALGLIDLEPWSLLSGAALRDRLEGLRHRYPQRTLVPLARRGDNDDVACWDLGAGTVCVIHDYATPGWEQKHEFEDFGAWFRQAVDDMLEFE